MDLREWSKSKAEYGRRLVDSGLEGVRSGEQAFLNGKSLTPFFSQSVRGAVIPAVLGAGVGALGSCVARRQQSVGRALGFGFLGAALGLVAGLVWESRSLTASVAGCALKNIGKARDEHWLTTHPIDYA